MRPGGSCAAPPCEGPVRQTTSQDSRGIGTGRHPQCCGAGSLAARGFSVVRRRAGISFAAEHEALCISCNRFDKVGTLGAVVNLPDGSRLVRVIRCRSLNGGDDEHRSSRAGGLDRQVHRRFLSPDHGRPSKWAPTTALADRGRLKATHLRRSPRWTRNKKAVTRARAAREAC